MTDEERVREITRRLEGVYGAAEWDGPGDPVDQLVGCILSQHTSDVNSHRAYTRLRERFPVWDAVLTADPSDVADAIRPGGLANSKARSIQAALDQIGRQEGDISLARLERMGDREAREYLLSLPGVGPKTAAIVLCFALGRPVLPVDTHVFRVAWRLGLIERRIGEAKAHDALQAMVPADITYRFHVAIIRHGRAVCRAPVPRCDACALTDMCRYYQETVKS